MTTTSSSPGRSRAPRRGFVLALFGVIALIPLEIVANQIWGRALGEPCGDSYACRGLLVSGVECVDVDGWSYCTLYCHSDTQCPAGWSCGNANPTVLGMATRVLDKVCLKGKGAHLATPTAD
jgi:hypothetical protein